MKAHSVDCIPAMTFSRSQNGWAEGAGPLKKTKDEEKMFTFTVLADVMSAEQLPTCLTNPDANIYNIYTYVNIYILNMRKIAIAKLQ